MTRNLYVGLSLTTALCAVAPAAWADVTAAEVWQNMHAPIQAMGGTISATAAQDGEITTYNDVAYTFTLPMGFGGGTITTPAVALIENADGTVTVQYPRDMTFGFSGYITGEGDVGAEIRVQLEQSNNMIASGTSGDVTYLTTSGNAQVSLGAVSVNGAPLDTVSMTANFQGHSTIEQRIIEGDLVQMSMAVEQEPSSGDVTIRFDSGQGGLITQQNMEYGGGETQIEIALPTGGSDLMNLAPAFVQGLSFAVTSAQNGMQNSQVETNELGVVMSSQTTATGATTTEISLNSDGLFVDVLASDLILELVDPTIPFPINFDATSLRAMYDIPISARPDAQDFGIIFDIDALRLGPAIWNMFDPEKAMDRTPADISLDIAGSTVLSADVTNFLDFGMRVDGGDLVATIEELELRELQLGALGATATATAALTFDNTDWGTYPGMPKPVGGLSFGINGLNAALDQLIAAGMIAQDEIFGVRMMLGMVTTASGDDSLSGIIEMGEDGSITANGQRLR